MAPSCPRESSPFPLPSASLVWPSLSLDSQHFTSPAAHPPRLTPACPSPRALALSVPSVWNALLLPFSLMNEHLLITWGPCLLLPPASPP